MEAYEEVLLMYKEASEYIKKNQIWILSAYDRRAGFIAGWQAAKKAYKNV